MRNNTGFLQTVGAVIVGLMVFTNLPATLFALVLVGGAYYVVQCYNPTK